MASLRRQLEELSQAWIEKGLPSRERIVHTGLDLIGSKADRADHGLWPVAPRLLTATLDDGIGQGLEVIQLFARAMGMQVLPLGLMQPAEVILEACRRHRPEYVGLTVLQLDSEDELAKVGQHLPAGTCLIAGGPAFRYDPEMATRCGVGFVAANVAYFIDFLMKRAVPRGDEKKNRYLN